MASTTIGRLNIMLTADANGVRTGLLVGEQALGSFAGRITSIYQSIRAQLQLNPLTQFLGWGVKLAAEGEAAETGFRIFLGSAEKAKELLGEIRQFALESPLNSAGLQQSANLLLGYGVAGERVIPILRQIGDVSGGNADKFGLLSLAVAQVISKARLQGGELRQLTESGFNPLKVIAEQTGLSMGELTKKMEDGAISSDMFLEALRIATSEGGQFFGMINAQSETLAGRWQNLQESAAVLAREVGEALAPSLMKLIATGKDMLEWFRALDETTVKNVATLTAMTAAFAAGAALWPRVITGISAVIKALRAMAIAESTVLALSGPQGLLALAGGAAAAAAAGIAISMAFDDLESKMPTVAAEAEKAATATSAMFDSLKADAGPSLDALREQLAGIRTEASEAKRHFDELIRRVESRRNSFTAAADRFTTSGQQAVASGAVERVIQEELRKLRDEAAAAAKASLEEEKRIERAIKERSAVKEARI